MFPGGMTGSCACCWQPDVVVGGINGGAAWHGQNSPSQGGRNWMWHNFLQCFLINAHIKIPGRVGEACSHSLWDGKVTSSRRGSHLRTLQQNSGSGTLVACSVRRCVCVCYMCLVFPRACYSWGHQVLGRPILRKPWPPSVVQRSLMCRRRVLAQSTTESRRNLSDCSLRW